MKNEVHQPFTKIPKAMRERGRTLRFMRFMKETPTLRLLSIGAPRPLQPSELDGRSSRGVHQVHYIRH